MSSNLGWYQLMTTWSKKIGGPKQFMGLLLGAGTLAGIGLSELGHGVKKLVTQKAEEKNKLAEAAIVHTVSKEQCSNEGLLFKAGDQFKVLERDGDAALIEKIGDDSNPYFVSAKFLCSISDYSF